MVRKRFLELAKRIARKSPQQMRFGVVLFNHRRLLSFGTNSNKTHPRSTTKYRTIHAELDACLGMPMEDLRGADALIVRLNRKEQLCISRPCLHCENLLRSVGIRRMIYTDREGQMKEEFLR